MPLITNKPTEAVANVIREHLEQRAVGGQFRTTQLREAAPANLSLAAPHPTYNLGLEAIGSAKPLDKAILTAWSYVVLNGEQSIATAEALPASGKRQPVFASTSEGPTATSIGTAIAVAEALPELQEKTYELAVLRVPALYVTALWLRGSERGTPDDLFIPLQPAPDGLKAEEKLTASAFLKILAELKARRGTSGENSN